MIDIFEFLKKRKESELFVRSSFFFESLKELRDIYESQSSKDKLFLVKENSNLDFVNMRVLILIKKYLGKEKLLEIYRLMKDSLVFFEDFLVKNKLLKDKRINEDLLSPGDFRTEDILFEEIEKEDNNFYKKGNLKNQEVIEKNDSFEIREKEILIFFKNGKVIKRTEPFLTFTNKDIPFIKEKVTKNGKYYYLGKYSFGENIDLRNKENSDKYHDVLLELIKKIKKGE